MAGRVSTWLACSAIYFVASLGIAMLAHGTDLDQLSGRSALSQSAAVVDRWLWAPYNWAGQQLGPAARLPGATPLLLVANTLAWGALLAAVWRALQRIPRA